jgi:polysulfide reductase chain C
MEWEWPIIIYLWVAGIAGGAYFVTFLAHRLSGGHYRDARRVAAALGVPAVVLGVVMLVIDLGHPFRAWHLFARFRPLSPMSMGSWLLLLWSVLAVVLFLTWWAESLSGRRLSGSLAPVIQFFQRLKPVSGMLDWVEFALSILLIAYTGVLLSATSQPLWANTFLLPVLFVSSAIATGIAALNLVGSLGVPQVGTSLMSKLCKAASVVCVVEILALAGLLLLSTAELTPVAFAASFSSSSSTSAVEAAHSVNQLLFGSLSFPFWVGVVLVGLVLPLSVEFSLLLRGVEKAPRELIALLGVMVLTGGLILRAVIVFAGQM